jgi:hypothetical protein
MASPARSRPMTRRQQPHSVVSQFGLMFMVLVMAKAHPLTDFQLFCRLMRACSMVMGLVVLIHLRP